MPALTLLSIGLGRGVCIALISQFGAPLLASAQRPIVPQGRRRPRARGRSLRGTARRWLPLFLRALGAWALLASSLLSSCGAMLATLGAAGSGGHLASTCGGFALLLSLLWCVRRPTRSLSPSALGRHCCLAGRRQAVVLANVLVGPPSPELLPP